MKERCLTCYITYPIEAMKNKKMPAELRRRRARFAAQVPDVEHLLRGTLVERFKKCGKPGCHCATGKGHGPACYLSVTLGPGKTRSYYVPKPVLRQIAQYLGNYQKLRKLLEEIIGINRELLERGALDEEG